MKHLLVIFILAIAGCTSNESKTSEEKVDTFSVEPPQPDITITAEKDSSSVDSLKTNKQKENTPIPQPKVYSNQRFKDVTVQNLGNKKFRVKGKGQIFEASFGWVIEDGHNEIKKGFEMTDAGAPEWGNFNFIVEAVKQKSNSTLHLILYESSAKDGSRQYELPIKLY